MNQKRAVKIALGQFGSEMGNTRYNLNKMLEYTDQAADAGADIVIFPELAYTGYFLPSLEMQKLAEPLDGPFVQTLRKKAEEKAKQLEDSLDEEEKRIRQEALDEATLESNKILDSFDGDMQRMQKQIEELTKQTNALLYENQGLRAKLESTASVPVLYMGGEYDFYPGEIKDLILSVLSDSVSGIHPDTRRMDVVKDIIRANGYRKLSEQKAEKVKMLLKNYKGMTGRLRQELLDLGFEITEDGKHIKLTYYGDERYQTVFAKTPSDGRAGKNNTQNVIRSCF